MGIAQNIAAAFVEKFSAKYPVPAIIIPPIINCIKYLYHSNNIVIII